MKIIGIVPARSGSVRVKDKNISKVGGISLITRALNTAKASGIFNRVVLSTDSKKYANIVKEEFDGELEIIYRPRDISGSLSPDIEWVKHAIKSLSIDLNEDAIAILRCTSPFRTVESIRNCWEKFKCAKVTADSIRAVKLTDKHPAKMWIQDEQYIRPILPYKNADVPWHSCQTSSLPEVYEQTASLEMLWTDTVVKKDSIAGQNVMHYITSGIETIDINSLEDLEFAKFLVDKMELNNDF